ncbi:MAG: fatty acid desaturase [Methylobacterium mesophilicum]|nr:fatty acid desaturase [Methylobacterium mesophilicum]
MARRVTARKAVEWPTVMLSLACYGLWIGALMIWQDYLIVAVLFLGVTLAMQSSLMHEACHGHPTRKAWLNELFVALPIGLIFPYRRFKALHLRHHADERLTDPFEDPESYYRARWQHETLPLWLQRLLHINNTMLGRFVIGPWLGTAGFVSSELRLLRAGDRAVRRAWLLHGLGLLLVLPFVTLVSEMPLWLYALGPVWIGQSLISVRTFAEHQWSERPDGRTLIVERSPFGLLFLNNNLHLVHHKNPTVAWYRLPMLFRERRGEWIRMNDGYVFPNYWSLFRAFALKAKEPVVHPILRRMPETGRVFRPRVRANNVHGLGTIVVPAQPPKD